MTQRLTTISVEADNQKMSISFDSDTTIDQVVNHVVTLLTFLGYHTETIKEYIDEN